MISIILRRTFTPFGGIIFHSYHVNHSLQNQRYLNLKLSYFNAQSSDEDENSFSPFSCSFWSSFSSLLLPTMRFLPHRRQNMFPPFAGGAFGYRQDLR